MTEQIFVSFDPLSLSAIIKSSDDHSESLISLRLILGSYSEHLEYLANGVQVPWYEFKRALTDISRWSKDRKVSMVFDEKAQEFVRTYIDEKNSIRSGREFMSVSQTEINMILDQQGFNRKLAFHQLRDLNRLLAMKHGANFSVPGAGKTTSVLALHTILKHFGQVSMLFVISPINAFISWEDEIKTIFPHKTPRVVRLRSDDLRNFYSIMSQQPDVILVNYEKMRRDVSGILSFFLTTKVHLVLDESHRIKGGTDNQSYSQIIRLADAARRRDILSGTPMPQSYFDLDPQFEFLWSVKVLPEVDGLSDNIIAEKISKEVAPFFVRTTKNELGLKDPKINPIMITMGPLQKSLYDLFRSEAARQLADMDKNSHAYFRSIGRSSIKLLQAASNPMLLGTDDEYNDEIIEFPVDSPAWELLSEFAKYEKATKLEVLKQRVHESLNRSTGQKVLIWTYFVRNIVLLEHLFAQHSPVSIYGNVLSGSDEDEQTREGRIRRFHQDTECRVMIANPQACGEGISLHRVCHHAIYLDRTFNAAHYLQSIDRIHRLGLSADQNTTVDILISKGTIDELLISRLNQKIETMGLILNDHYLSKLAYDPFDIPIRDYSKLDKQDVVDIQRHLEE